MIKISDYSLNYSRLISEGRMSIAEFLAHCRELDIEGASLHVRNLPDLSTGYLKKMRRAYLDHGLSISMFSVTTNFGNPAESARAEFEKALEAIHAARQPNGVFLSGCKTTTMFTFAGQERTCSVSRSWSITLTSH